MKAGRAVIQRGRGEATMPMPDAYIPHGARPPAAGRELLSKVTGQSLRVALEGQIRCLKSEDFKEGRQAMAEGRSPQWQGR
jgi:hypothetical protein